MRKSKTVNRAKSTVVKQKVQDAGAVIIAPDRQLPATAIRATPVPVKIAAIVVQSCSYSEGPNPQFQRLQESAIQRAEVGLRSEYGWIGQDAIALVAHVKVTTPRAPVLVDCNVAVRVVFQRAEQISNEDLWTFVKASGLRVAYPYMRSAVANLTALGTLGSIALDPLYLSLE